MFQQKLIMRLYLFIKFTKIYYKSCQSSFNCLMFTTFQMKLHLFICFFSIAISNLWIHISRNQYSFLVLNKKLFYYSFSTYFPILESLNYAEYCDDDPEGGLIDDIDYTPSTISEDSSFSCPDDNSSLDPTSPTSNLPTSGKCQWFYCYFEGKQQPNFHVLV